MVLLLQRRLRCKYRETFVFGNDLCSHENVSSLTKWVWISQLNPTMPCSSLIPYKGNGTKVFPLYLLLQGRKTGWCQEKSMEEKWSPLFWLKQDVCMGGEMKAFISTRGTKIALRVHENSPFRPNKIPHTTLFLFPFLFFSNSSIGTFAPIHIFHQISLHLSKPCFLLAKQSIHRSWSWRGIAE